MAPLKVNAQILRSMVIEGRNTFVSWSPRDAFDAPCELLVGPRLNGEVDPPNRALRPAVPLCSSLPCVMFLNQLALSGRIPVPAIAVSESSFTQPNSAVSQCINSQMRSPLYSNLRAKYH